jgi:hypothetical protein
MYMQQAHTLALRMHCTNVNLQTMLGGVDTSMSCFDDSNRAAIAATTAAVAATTTAEAAAVELYSDLRLDNTLCEHAHTDRVYAQKLKLL